MGVTRMDECDMSVAECDIVQIKVWDGCEVDVIKVYWYQFTSSPDKNPPCNESPLGYKPPQI